VSIDFPYGIDGRGRTAVSDGDAHVRDLIEQVLFTAPGERVMAPEFGSGLQQLVFEPGGAELLATTQALVAGALQRWLGDVVQVQDVTVAQDDGVLSVTVTYVVLRTRAQATSTFTRSAP
jgi:phage baseplate assembly protein W